MKAKNSTLVTNLVFLFLSQFDSGSAESISPYNWGMVGEKYIVTELQEKQSAYIQINFFW